MVARSFSGIDMLSREFTPLMGGRLLMRCLLEESKAVRLSICSLFLAVGRWTLPCFTAPYQTDIVYYQFDDTA